MVAEEIFHRAVEIADPSGRSAYLDEACKADPMLRAEVEALLAAHEQAGTFLESPAVDPSVTLDASPLIEGPGTVIGPYKLLEKIGEGGMAVVYMAEQQRPFQRRVALKIIKLGMDTKQVIARFEAERQALAMMDHPNIAKVFDAGATETGRPYFVMELVQGVSITEYCDKNNLSTKDRLTLFMQVCSAIQHAHTKGIIHRDIKPSNVMVTHHDGKPTPKVIDFGIAKATNQRLTEKTLFTRYAHLIGTPAYMSPEQAELSDLDIDTRTDIYSLGVLLYELLTSTTPFSEEELRRAGYLDMQKVIREQEPVKPSTKLTTLGDTLTDVAKHRNCTPDLLRKALRGDLDWIVMKALEKDRTRRYETPNSLAEDLRRHLDHEPVVAHSPSTLYWLRRFLRRHRSQAIAALAMMVVAGAGSVILWRWNQDRSILAGATLSQARGQYANGEREAALETIEPILRNRHVGPEARLLHAGILADDRHFEEALSVLKNLVNERAEIAGAAHSLWVRILWESSPLNADKLKQIEEHRQQAEALPLETAEAHFMRAITAATVQEQLASLDKALQLNKDHYDSLRLQTFIYYASRKYEEMRDNAFLMTHLHPKDPLGHSLRATALRELGKYREAVREYENTMAWTPKTDGSYMALATQRCDTLLRTRDYRRIIAEAPAGAKDVSPLQNHLFSALTAVGDYDKAAALFRQIVGPGYEARQQFRNWCAKYVFDMLAAGRSWHPEGPTPAGAAFLPMVEAEETYRALAAKGRCLTTDGFGGQWSPDGKKLAFSLGVQGRSGIAVFDPAQQETTLLIVPGKYPRWSPDGRCIAFVRDREFLPVPEFVSADPTHSQSTSIDEEVWLMNSDGSAPRRLARGAWPSWARDSNGVYYKSRSNNTLYSISVTGEHNNPKQIAPCPEWNPSVSPDNRRVASIKGSTLKVKDLVSQTVTGTWRLPMPSDGWGAPAWSPAGDQLCIGGSGGPENRTGLWVYRLDHPEPVKILEGPITLGSWSPDGTKLAFELGAPCLAIWVADLDPNVSTAQALGPARNIEEHLRDVIAFDSRRIKADPLDAGAYYDRARCYDGLHERLRAQDDMRRWSAAASGRLPGDFRRVLDLPFDCELVFSAERPVNKISVLSVAFGQKGKCEMKLFEIPMVVTSLVGLSFLAGLDMPARADFTFGAPVDVQSAFPLLNFALSDAIGCFSADGVELYIDASSFRSGGQGQDDIWVCKRASPQDAWGLPENLGPTINSAQADMRPSITADGLELYFQSARPGGFGNIDLYVIKRATRNSLWGPPTNLGAPVNTSANDGLPSVSSDGLELYFQSGRAGGYGGFDLYVSKRATRNDPWGAPVNLGPVVNSPAYESLPFLSPDGLLLLFSDPYYAGTLARPGGYGGSDIWLTRRASRSGAWEPPVNLGPMINGPDETAWACLAPDGSALYFMRVAGDNWTEMKAPILPVVDFNADNKVDVNDLRLLIDNWGTTNKLYDIGPYAWGDGKVDIEDVKAFTAEWERQNPPAKP